MFKKKKAVPEGRRAPAASEKNKAVFSYYQNRDAEFDASRSRDKPSFGARLWSRLRHAPSLIAVLAIVASLLWMLSLSASPQVKVVNEQNAARQEILRPVSDYQVAAERLMQQSVLTRNKLTLNTRDIELSLQEEFSEITNVAVVLPIVSRTPVVYVQIAEPVVLLESGSGRFVVDEQGRVLINASQVEDVAALDLITVKDAAGLAIQPGSQVLTGHDVRFMKTVREQLSASGIAVERMELPAKASELHVFIKGQKYYVKFTTSGDALEEVGTYLALRDKLAGEQKTTAEYVDVRVAERAYYK